MKREQLQAFACERAGHAVELEEYFGSLPFAFTPVDPKQRICRMTWLLAGQPAMNDWRKFRMDPQDAEMVRSNFLKDGSVPMLYDHGFTALGTMQAGRILELPTDTPDIDGICKLTPRAWKQAVEDEEWASRSAGFYGWTDKEDFIHPVALREGSLTSLPAMAGLGGVRLFSEVRDVFRRVFDLAQQPSHPAATLPPPAAADTESPSGEGKEESMSLSKETLTMLGLNEGATDAQVEAALRGRLSAAPTPAPAAAPTPAPAAGAPAPTVVGMTAEQVQALVGQSLQTTVAAAMADNERTRAISELVQDGVLAGRLPSGDGDEARAERESYAAIGRAQGTTVLKAVIASLAVRFPPAPGRGVHGFTRNAGDTPRDVVGASAPAPRPARHAADYVGANPTAFDQSRMPLHDAVISYMKANGMTGKPGEYPRALSEVTRRRTVLREVPVA